jgi:tetratricopeptide (TPR) repeat protein
MEFDDGTAILRNPTLGSLWTALHPPPDTTVSGRPVLNLSFALNAWASGSSVWSYHALNLAIHAAAALALLGVLRRGLARAGVRDSAAVALMAALLWSVHPLLTGSVTYIVQRAESLMALFFLLTLYGFIRGAEAGPPRSRAWLVLSAAACLLGMGTKESMAAAPLVVLLYDRTFHAGSVRECLRRRGVYYAALAATWVILILLATGTGGRFGTVGFEGGVTAGAYLLTQAAGIARYLSLCIFPRSLVFDYGTGVEAPSLRVVPYVLAIAALVAASVWAAVRRRPAGILGVAFFAVLAPSSSILPVVTETLAEHRMYLPSAAVATFIVLAVFRLPRRVALPACAVAAAVLVLLTRQRNAVYRSEESLWADTVAKLPNNERAHYNLGIVLQQDPARLSEAVSEYSEAVRLRPGYYQAQGNLANALVSLGRVSEAIPHYEAAIRARPGEAEAHNNLGNALRDLGRNAEAIGEYREALSLRPGYVEAHNNLGCALEDVPGELEAAVAEFRAALGAAPGFYQAHFNLANALKAEGRYPEAVAEYQEAVRLKPDDPTIHFYLSGALLQMPGGVDGAIAELRETLRLRPDDAKARSVLARLLSTRP